MHDARRRWLRRAGASALASASGLSPAGSARAGTPQYPEVVRGVPLSFPRDHGAHDEYRTEWWYVTGWLERLDGAHRGQPAGVQITFFRTRTHHDAANPSRFAPVQLLFAHAALALAERGSLLHAQRAARKGLGLAQASGTDTDVRIGDWSLARDAQDAYRTRIVDPSLELELSFRARTPPLLQGERGFSRKGPRPTQASYYYSRPQLEVRGTIRADARREAVEGIAWLDHEWSSEILDPSAVGWDWVGLNLDDGSALTAFRIRTRDGATLWTYARRADAGTMRSPSDGATGFPAEQRGRPDVRFEPQRHWTSPRTGVRYPVAMRVSIDERSFTLEPLFDDQELDTRATTGVVYWEGAVRVFEHDRPVGRGYLELTGYAARVRF
ncbi:MAG TPA: lipocalin-like domain-containing protein [Zeimonas sp.]